MSKAAKDNIHLVTTSLWLTLASSDGHASQVVIDEKVYF